jgi:hypothetical protein
VRRRGVDGAAQRGQGAPPRGRTVPRAEGVGGAAGGPDGATPRGQGRRATRTGREEGGRGEGKRRGSSPRDPTIGGNHPSDHT